MNYPFNKNECGSRKCILWKREKNNGDSHLAPRFDRVAVRWAEETLRYFRSRAGLARELQVV